MEPTTWEEVVDLASRYHTVRVPREVIHEVCAKLASLDYELSVARESLSYYINEQEAGDE